MLSIKLLSVVTTFALVVAISTDNNPHGKTITTENLKKMEEEKIIPDVIDKLPTSQLSVTFANDKKVQLGNDLTPTEVKDVPTVNWEGDKDMFYTLSMVDPDAPSRKEPKWREVNHWLVVNIPGSKLADGDVITAFMSSGPPKGTEKHRYVFLLFKQSKKIIFDEPKTAPFSRQHRLNFSIRKLAAKYGLGEPIAGNFYQAEWDPYVDERNKKITS